MDYINDIYNFILHEKSVFHFNTLLLIGIAIFGGTIGGKLFQKIKIPQVVGYIIVGVITGSMGLNIISKDIIQAFDPFNYFALGIISFMIGGELEAKTIKKYGKQFLAILFFEGTTSFILVGLLVFAIAYFYLPLNTAIALSLLLGAIASATAAAGTTDVLWETKAKGPLTTTIFGIVALDDGFALVLFTIAASVAQSILGNGSQNILMQIIIPAYEVLGSIIFGILSGYITAKIIRNNDDDERILAFSIGSIILLIGFSILVKVDILLASMTFGIMLVNYSPIKSIAIFKLVKEFAPPIYILFFVMFGAKLDIQNISPFILYITLVFLIGRSLGKGFGATIGAKLSKAPQSVIKYLRYCLLSQSGVAIGLSTIAASKFSQSPEVGNSIVIIITTTTFIVQLAGPALIKYAIVKAEEDGIDLSEDDFIKRSKASDVMDTDFSTIYEYTKLEDIIKVFKESQDIYFPVVNAINRLSGIITVDGIKHTLLEEDIQHLLVGTDLMQPVIAYVFENTPLQEVKDKLKNFNLEYLPVLDEEEKITGYIRSSKIDRYISKKLLKFRQRSERNV